MRRSRKSIQLALLIGLQLQLTLMSVNLSGAFQFWPSKLSQRSTRQQEQRTSAAPSVRHRLENVPQTTTTTPSATLAPSGHQLELNAEVPEAPRQPSDESSFEVNTQLNGSLILEDLVNQLKRNFNQMKRGGESSDEATDSLQYEAGAANRTNKPNERHLAEIVVEPTTEISLEILHSTAGSSLKQTPNDSLVDLHQADQEDRHIQYDSMAATSSLATNEIGGVPVDETGLTAQNFTLVPLTDSSNFTLDPIRVQSEQIFFNNSLEDLRRRLDADSAGSHEGAQEIYSNNSLLVLSAGESQREQQARHKSHQARSMGNNSPRAAQLSKPPYASYNQFHESRSQLATPPAPPLQLVTTNNHNNRASLSDSLRSNSSPHQRAPNETGAHLTRASDIKLEAGGELVNSMGRISSQLGGEPTRPQSELNATSASASATATATATTTTSTPATTITARPAPVGDVIAQSYEFLRERQQAQQQQQLERMAPKLAPINDPVDLSPISSTSSSLEPSSLAYSANGLNHQMDSGEISPSQFYFSQTPFGHAHESRSPTPTGESGSNLQRNFQNDRYSFDSANLIFSQQLSEPANQLFHTRGDNNQAASPSKQLSSRATTSSDRVAAHFRPVHDLDEASPVLSSHSVGSASASASSLSLPFGPQLHRKTLELVSNQIQHADQVGPVHQHKERSPNSLEQQRGAGSHAASLINVTAPMVLPLSATEAMEASLDAALQDLQAPHGHHQRPANYLAPRPTTSYTTATSGAEPTFGGPAQSLENSPANLLAANLGVAERERLRVGDSARAPPSGFRSPFLNNGYLASPDGLVPTPSSAWFQTTSLPAPSSYLSGGATSGRFSANGASSTQAPPVAQTANNSSQAPQANRNPPSPGQTPMRNSTAAQQEATPGNQANLATTTNGFLIGSGNANSSASDTSTMGGSQQQVPQTSSQLQVGSSSSVGSQQQPPQGNKRVFNLTRVEHISAECSNDLIRTVIIFNGTFKGIIYSSGYVRDPNCLYVNGTGKTRYDFSIRLNQCGTLGRQELHPSSRPNELNRRDQVMWNTLSIQYNPIVEQEWDEHFRVSCEYGGDFWKTISFSPFNVETNTGSPVVFTVDPPQCQMEILKGHGMVGPRQEAVSGPVTVGDPLTLLIHMKSEKAGYDILVKNCIAHNGGQQKMQLIDNSGCVVNERFISPFRGTYNDNDLKHVTLYSYLKAFRFTGSPVLYLECEVHMCQSACPPQMCYWRTLSKRSINETRLLAGNDALQDHLAESQFDLSDRTELEDDLRSIRFNLTPSTSTTTTTTTTTSTTEPSVRRGQRTSRSLHQATASGRNATEPAAENLSDRVSLFQALEVRQEREPENLPEAFSYDQPARRSADERQLEQALILCYRRGEVFAFLFTVGSILLAAISLTIGCCFRASSLKRQARHQAAKSKRQQQFVSQAFSLTSANLGYAPLTSYLSPSHSTGSSCPSSPAGSSYASSSQHSPNSGSRHYAPEVADSKQSRQLPACPVSSLATLIEQQQQQQQQQQQHQLKLVEVAARKSAYQTQFRG